MPRRFRNFKIRPAKFLGAHHTKYESTGTYTGAYKGTPVSRRRLAILRRERIDREELWGNKRPPRPPKFVNSPLSKPVPIQTISAERNSGVFLFTNTRTKQVVYSLTGHLEPQHALPQLTFYGKKTVPMKYRRDDWRPFAAIDFDNPAKALLCYWYLRDLRMLRDYAWRDAGSRAPPKKLRNKEMKNLKYRTDPAYHQAPEDSDAKDKKSVKDKKHSELIELRASALMNQRASAVCDACTAIQKVNDNTPQDVLDLLVQWKIVKDLADEASYGALSVLRKQIARGQRVLNNKKKDKKFPNVNSRLALQKQMNLWYRQQTMMYKAMAAVRKVEDAEDQGQELATRISDATSIEGKCRIWGDNVDKLFPPSLGSQQVPDGDPSKSSKQLVSKLEHPSFTKAHGVDLTMDLKQMRDQMVRIMRQQRFQKVWPKSARLFDLSVLVNETEGLSAQSADILAAELMTLSPDLSPEEREIVRLEIRAGVTHENGELLVSTIRHGIKQKRDQATPITTVFWSALSDRKYNSEWPEYIAHMALGPGTSGRQFYVHNLSEIAQDAEHLLEGIFQGNEKNDEGFEAVEEQKHKATDKVKQVPFEKLALKSPEAGAVHEHYWQFIDSAAKKHGNKTASATQKPVLPADLMSKSSSTMTQSIAA